MIADGRLVLRHRRPLTHPYPNAYSHPLPLFRYYGHTGRLTVDFDNDPEFVGGTAWRAKTFYLTALPRPRPRSLLDDATKVLASAVHAPLSLFGSPSIPAHDSIAAGKDDSINLRQEELEEQDRGEDAEVDDDLAHDRAVCVIGLMRQGHLEFSDKASARRQWEVLPLRTTLARYSTSSKCMVYGSSLAGFLWVLVCNLIVHLLLVTKVLRHVRGRKLPDCDNMKQNTRPAQNCAWPAR